MSGLRAALRTEPNVRLAVLFGSTATGEDEGSSDVDLLVVLRDPDVGRMAELAGRLSPAAGRDVQLVRLSEAEDSPALMLECWSTDGCSSTAKTGGLGWRPMRAVAPAGPPRRAASARRTRRRRSRRVVGMSAAKPPPAPLESSAPARARALKAKVRDRVGDVRRHLLALRTAMGEFGEDFDLDAFRGAYASEDPVTLNHVKAVERGVDQLYNYIAELSGVRPGARRAPRPQGRAQRPQ